MSVNLFRLLRLLGQVVEVPGRARDHRCQPSDDVDILDVGRLQLAYALVAAAYKLLQTLNVFFGQVHVLEDPGRVLVHGLDVAEGRFPALCKVPALDGQRDPHGPWPLYRKHAFRHTEMIFDLQTTDDNQVDRGDVKQFFWIMTTFVRGIKIFGMPCYTKHLSGWSMRWYLSLQSMHKAYVQFFTFVNLKLLSISRLHS